MLRTHRTPGSAAGRAGEKTCRLPNHKSDLRSHFSAAAGVIEKPPPGIGQRGVEKQPSFDAGNTTYRRAFGVREVTDDKAIR